MPVNIMPSSLVSSVGVVEYLSLMMDWKVFLSKRYARCPLHVSGTRIAVWSKLIGPYLCMFWALSLRLQLGCLAAGPELNSLTCLRL